MAFWSLNHQSPATPAATLDTATYKSELQHAYDRGRLEARPRRRGSLLGGFAAFISLVLAALAVIFIVAAVQEGSFQGGGALIDQTLNQITGGRYAAQAAAASTAGMPAMPATAAASAPAGATPDAAPPAPAKPATSKPAGAVN